MAVTTALVTAGVAATASAVDSSMQARRAAKEQRRSISSQQDIVKDKYKHYRDYFRPIETRVAQDTLGGVDPNYASKRAGADVQQATGLAVGSMARDLTRLGIDPGAQRFQESLADLRIARAAIEAGARTTARQRGLSQNQQARMQAMQYGQGIASQAQQGYASIAQQYGDQAASFNDAAAGATRAAIGSFGQLAMGGMMNQSPQVSSTFDGARTGAAQTMPMPAQTSPMQTPQSWLDFRSGL
jgi:hypothetical protein